MFGFLTSPLTASIRNKHSQLYGQFIFLAYEKSSVEQLMGSKSTRLQFSFYAYVGYNQPRLGIFKEDGISAGHGMLTLIASLRAKSD